jgi:hypothetical protein
VSPLPPPPPELWDWLTKTLVAGVVYLAGWLTRHFQGKK